MAAINSRMKILNDLPKCKLYGFSNPSENEKKKAENEKAPVFLIGCGAGI
jgi:hypothetical protein